MVDRRATGSFVDQTASVMHEWGVVGLNSDANWTNVQSCLKCSNAHCLNPESIGECNLSLSLSVLAGAVHTCVWIFGLSHERVLHGVDIGSWIVATVATIGSLSNAVNELLLRQFKQFAICDRVVTLDGRDR